MSANSRGVGIEQPITQLAVNILFNDSTGFDEMSRTVNLLEKQN